MSSVESDSGTAKPESVSGRLFQPRSSRFVTATLTLNSGYWRATPDDHGTPVVDQVAEVFIDDPVKGLPRKLSFSAGHVFECDDHMAFEHLAAQAEGRPVGRPRSLGLSPGRWVALVVAAILMPIAIWFGYPHAADSIALALPTSVDQAIGTGVVEEMDDNLFEPSALDSAQKAELKALFDEIVLASNTDPESVRLLFRKSWLTPLNLNAIAFPDGTIVLFDGLVDLSEHPDELASVLAHEIGHIKHRHAIRKIVRASGVTILVTMFLGDSTSFVEEIIAVGVGIAELSYSREFEIESDTEAGMLMRQMGRDPEKLIDLLRRINANCGEECEETGLLSTHPGLRDRLKAVTEN